MGGHGDRPAARRARTDSAAEPCASTGNDGAPVPGVSGLEAQRPAAGPGLEGALHGAPDLLAALAMAGEAQPGGRPSHALRLVSKACREAVDGAVTRTQLFFDDLYQRGAQSGAAGGASSEAVAPLSRSQRLLRAWAPKQHFACDWPRDSADQRAAAWLEPMVRRLARLPRLAEVTCWGPGGAELEQLLAMAAAAHPSALAGVQRLDVHGCSGGRNESGVCGPGLPALLRSLAHLPGLQVRCWGSAVCPCNSLCWGGGEHVC
jgi:hypothetical protein